MTATSLLPAVGIGVADDRWARDDPDEALRALAALPPSHPSRPAVREQVIEAWLPLATNLAHRFSGRGEPVQDLAQTAAVGLIKAVDRFDVHRGYEFTAFAVPTIIGEIRRYFRDQAWDLHVPRRLQELRLAIAEATATLAQQLGHSPTPAELAADLGLSEADVWEGLKVANAYHASSLDAPAWDAGDDAAPALAELLGTDDPELARAELRVAIAPALAALPERERRILHLRFVRNLTQDQIAARVGLSQMHVSRLLTRMLGQLRTVLLDSFGRGRP